MAEHEKNNLKVSDYHFNQNSKYLNKVFYAKTIMRKLGCLLNLRKKYKLTHEKSLQSASV